MMNSKIKFLRGEMERIRTANGGILEAEDVLSAASNPKSPLHPMFEWDDRTAAHNYRLDQARELIRSVHIETVNTTMDMAPLYVRSPESKSGYISLLADDSNNFGILANEDRAILSLLERRLRISEALGDSEPNELSVARVFLMGGTIADRDAA
jgi:chorismate mutase